MLSSVSQMVNLIENGKWKMENCFVFLFPLTWGRGAHKRQERGYLMENGNRSSEAKNAGKGFIEWENVMLNLFQHPTYNK